MSDIFLSYASADRERVRPLVRALERHSWSVWWDRTILPGRTFDQVIEEALAAARCVIVVWSQHSVDSDWVKTEAAEGARRRMLVPVLLDEGRIPLEFRRMQAACLLDWHDTGPHSEFDKVVRAVTHVLRPPSLTAEGTLESGAVPSSLPLPSPASPRDDKPFGAAPRREEPATPSVSATDQPEGHRPTTSNTPETTQRSRRHKRWRLWVGGVLLGVLVTALYLALHQGKVFDTAPTPAPHAQINDPKSPATPKTPTVPGRASDAAMSSATDQAIQMPDSRAVTMSYMEYKFQYTILSAQRKRLPPDKQLLRFRIRVWTDFVGGTIFWSDSFRLSAGDLRIKPANDLKEMVSRDETKEGDIEFEVDGSIKEAILVISVPGLNSPGNTRQLRLAFP